MPQNSSGTSGGEESESSGDKHATMRSCMELLSSGTCHSPCLTPAPLCVSPLSPPPPPPFTGTCTIEAACARVRIGRTTFYRWLTRARDPHAAPIFHELLAVADKAKQRMRDNGSTAAQLGNGKLSKELSETFVALLKTRTCTREVACLRCVLSAAHTLPLPLPLSCNFPPTRSVGIGRTTFYRWLERARKPDAPAHFRDFLAAVEQAQQSLAQEGQQQELDHSSTTPLTTMLSSPNN